MPVPWTEPAAEGQEIAAAYPQDLEARPGSLRTSPPAQGHGAHSQARSASTHQRHARKDLESGTPDYNKRDGLG